MRCLPAFLLVGLACRSAPSSGDSTVARYAPSACKNCEEWSKPQAPFRLHGNSYYVGTRGLAAVLITSPAGHILIDGALPNNAPAILESIRVLGFTPRDVKLILNTHAHFDHAGGIAALQRATGAKVMASPASAGILRRGNSGPDDPQYGDLLDFPTLSSVGELADGVAVTVGTLAVTPHFTPAHMPGGTSWSWRSCDAAGCINLVYADSQSLLRVGAFRFSARADLPAVRRGYDVLEQLPCDLLITPHPDASAFWERQASPTGLIDGAACRRYAQGARERLAQQLTSEAGARR